MQTEQYLPAVNMKYADIVIDNKSRMTDSFYTYLCEDEWAKVGQKVYVPFAKGRNLREGYIFHVREEDDRDLRFRKVDHIDENICLTQEMVETCIWMKKRYLVKYIDGIRCFIPPGAPPKRELKEKKPDSRRDEKKSLTQEQESALDCLLDNIRKEKHDIFLIHGVTSSGKTEVYMQAIERVLEKGKTAIMMVPEISLTKQMIGRFEKRFGSERLAVMHSKMTKGQRYVQWQKIRGGTADVVIGARSAVFAPLENIGIVILDEEHESTYKSDMTPRYETLEVAIKRSKAYKGIVVLGSATPSAVSEKRCREGIYKKIEMKKRYNENPMPFTHIADMAEEMRRGNRNLISTALYEKTKEALEKGRQVIYLLNRRGFSTYISCGSCGHVFTCPVCGITLTYHKDMNGNCCHYCGYSEPASGVCPECGKETVEYRGSGTQKLEDEVERLFPEAVYDRLDLDSVKRAGAMEKILSDFAKGKTNILIGTQLVAKGLDFDNVGLVGIVSADSSLNIPDYRSAEKTFQLITQASGRAGRGDFTGEVVIQTFSPENYAVLTAASNDYDAFVEEELSLREKMEYPPFADIIRLVFSGDDESLVKKEAESWYEKLKKKTGERHTFRPQPAPMNRIKDTFRYSMMIKCPKGMRNHHLGILEEIDRENNSKGNKINVGIDINPYSFI